MENRRLKVNVGRTINTGNFETFRGDVGLEADIDDRVPSTRLMRSCFQKLANNWWLSRRLLKGKGWKEENRRADIGGEKGSILYDTPPKHLLG